MSWLVLIEIEDKMTGLIKRGWRKCKNWNEVKKSVEVFWKIQKRNGKSLRIEIYRASLFKRVEGKKIIWN